MVPAGPFTGLFAVDAPAYLSYAVASRPGEPVLDAGAVVAALGLLRAEFGPGAVRFELIDEACPGAVRLLVEAGLEITLRTPLMTLAVDRVRVPETAPGVTVEYVSTTDDRAAGAEVANTAFGADGGDLPTTPPPPPVDGGSVLARVDGEPAAVASWTQIADGITEIVGVATAERYRRRGLGALVTAHAVEVAGRAGATLTWLTPGGADADRVYRGVGFTPVAWAVHLAEPSAGA